eukprot:jgi/Orpsp1_1/1183701/evm.model.c7180000086344.1
MLYYGGISFSYTKLDGPYFTNIDDLLKINSAIVTNPSHIKLTLDSKDSVKILSGESLNNINLINTDPVEKVTDMIFFKAELNDTYNAKLICQSGFYCDIGICTIPSLKIVGNPGNYDLLIKIHNFGNYKYFNDNIINISLKIEDCNNKTYLYQDIENIGLKSCYLPTCNPSCNTGKCININVCDCSKSQYIGFYCNEYYRRKEEIML